MTGEGRCPVGPAGADSTVGPGRQRAGSTRGDVSDVSVTVATRQDKRQPKPSVTPLPRSLARCLSLDLHRYCNHKEEEEEEARKRERSSSSPASQPAVIDLKGEGSCRDQEEGEEVIKEGRPRNNRQGRRALAGSPEKEPLAS
uniref:Uncharacterized protein n=2 Tax=Oryza TaxID=4527 RepID=A0A0D3HGX0_9ORYZ